MNSEIKKLAAKRRSAAQFKIMRCEQLPPEIKTLAWLIIDTFRAGGQYQAGWVPYTQLMRELQRSRSRVAALLKMLASLGIFQTTKLKPQELAAYCERHSYKLGLKAKSAVVLYEANLDHELWNGQPGRLSAAASRAFAEALDHKPRARPKSTTRHLRSSCRQDDQPVLPAGRDFIKGFAAASPAVLSPAKPSYWRSQSSFTPAAAEQTGFASGQDGNPEGQQVAPPANTADAPASGHQPLQADEGPSALLPGAHGYQHGLEAVPPNKAKENASPGLPDDPDFSEFICRYETLFGRLTPVDKRALAAEWNELRVDNTWRALLDQLAGHNYFAGRKPGSNGRPFQMTVGWLLGRHHSGCKRWQAFLLGRLGFQSDQRKPIEKRLRRQPGMTWTDSLPLTLPVNRLLPYERERAIEICRERDEAERLRSPVALVEESIHLSPPRPSLIAAGEIEAFLARLS